MGKSSLVLNIAEHAGTKEKKPTLIFSMEMSAQQVAQKYVVFYRKN